MSDSENDPWQGTVWSNNPGRGTIYDNNPHRDTVWDNRNDPQSFARDSIPANETWTQREERRRLERQGISPTSNNLGRGGFGVGGIVFFLVIFNIAITYAYATLAGVINGNTGEGALRYNLLNWLTHTFYIFLPIATIVLFINLLLRRYWSGTMLVIATGILSFIGTGIYLVVSGVFFGK